MKNIFFIGWQDVRFQLRDGGTLLWLFVMPPIFFYFIGTVTSGFSSGMSGGGATPLTVVAENPGFLKEQVDLRLEANDFAPEWVESLETSDDDIGKHGVQGPLNANLLELACQGVRPGVEHSRHRFVGDHFVAHAGIKRKRSGRRGLFVAGLE